MPWLFILAKHGKHFSSTSLLPLQYSLGTSLYLLILREEMNLLFPTKNHIYFKYVSGASVVLLQSGTFRIISIFADLMQRNVVVTASHKTYSKYVSGTSLLLL